MNDADTTLQALDQADVELAQILASVDKVDRLLDGRVSDDLGYLLEVVRVAVEPVKSRVVRLYNEVSDAVDRGDA